MCEKFAKLFEIGDGQVLLFSEYDADTDETIMHQITTIIGIRADIKVMFKGENQEELAETYLSVFESKKAQKLREMVVEMFNL